MKEDENIDQLFHNKLFERDLSYDPQAWPGAEKLLVDQGKKRYFLYRYRYYLSTIALLITSSLTYLVLNNQNNDEKDSMICIEC